jgi:hypothetical protein
MGKIRRDGSNSDLNDGSKSKLKVGSNSKPKDENQE